MTDERERQKPAYENEKKFQIERIKIQVEKIKIYLSPQRFSATQLLQVKLL